MSEYRVIKEDGISFHSDKLWNYGNAKDVWYTDFLAVGDVFEDGNFEPDVPPGWLSRGFIEVVGQEQDDAQGEDEDDQDEDE